MIGATMSVLEKLPSLIDRPRRSRRRHRPDQAKPTSSSSSVAPITRAPSSAPESPRIFEDHMGQPATKSHPISGNGLKLNLPTGDPTGAVSST